MINYEKGEKINITIPPGSNMLNCDLNGLDGNKIPIRFTNDSGKEEMIQGTLTYEENPKLASNETNGFLILTDDEGVQHALNVICSNDKNLVNCAEKEIISVANKKINCNRVRKVKDKQIEINSQLLKHQIQSQSKNNNTLDGRISKAKQSLKNKPGKQLRNGKTINNKNDGMNQVNCEIEKERTVVPVSVRIASEDYSSDRSDETMEESKSLTFESSENDSISSFRLNTVNPPSEDINPWTGLSIYEPKYSEIQQEEDNTSKLTESSNNSYSKGSSSTVKKPSDILKLMEESSKIMELKNKQQNNPIRIKRFNNQSESDLTETIVDKLSKRNKIRRTMQITERCYSDTETLISAPISSILTQTETTSNTLTPAEHDSTLTQTNETQQTTTETKKNTKINLADCHIDDNPKLNEVVGINKFVCCDFKHQRIFNLSDILELLVKLNNSRIDFAQWLQKHTRINDKDNVTLLTSIEGFMQKNFKLMDEGYTISEQTSQLTSVSKSFSMMQTLKDKMDSSLSSPIKRSNSMKTTTNESVSGLFRSSYNTRSRRKRMAE
ncbi:hypothetical protein SNEBB_001986 [Seison nebaliae]|nr:hypothetical protein SNEBB_001986 [Seison nebaliae]